MKTYVLYHSGCNDGFCAAWVAHQHLGNDNGEDNVEYLPVRYGEVPPAMEDGSRVLILDFSYPRAVLAEIASKMKSLAVLDHHKTAEADLRDFAPPNAMIVFDMGKSGARLTWEYFGGHQRPSLVDYTEDRDLWRWNLPESRAINAAIASYPHDFMAWDAIEARLRVRPSSLVAEGQAILRYVDQQIERICKNAVEIEMEGHKILAVNTCCLQSEVAGKLAEGRPFGATWHVRSDGKRQWSLRSRDSGVDVSDVAQAHGGGGHRNTAGFEEAHVA